MECTPAIVEEAAAIQKYVTPPFALLMAWQFDKLVLPWAMNYVTGRRKRGQGSMEIREMQKFTPHKMGYRISS